MSWAEVHKINSNIKKPLDDLIAEKTNVKMQTIYFAFKAGGSSVSAPNTVNVGIVEVDIQKSIIVPISYVNTASIKSLSYNFVDSTTVSCTRSQVSGYAQTDFTVSAIVITFGGNVTTA